ncbi:mitochondrial processing peptidase-like protein [Geminocystis sp. NIES-3708]|uniref:M16 family metallopeptidase n=1 Tax=Geminocystis sp. NIES-3708 TaxID=1615909 RepID=UPI0005FC4904|nr:pitrilysin family protein [Geminocystis sp. NIES-3708]BAQ59831.1 mitochondrial processing peptidase-like protein [Geminocystis sp. NIES-3708]
MTFTLVRPNCLHSPTITTLPNGLTIIAEQIPVSAVNLNIWFNVGSAIETDNINGMAHFLEHMIFKGSHKLASGEFERLLEAKGAVTNAATSQEYTHFYFTCTPEDFAEILPLQLDLVLNPLLPSPEFDREKMVVLEEIRRSHDNPRRRLSERMMNNVFPNLPYHRPILGTTEIIENLTCKQMQSFHDSWYQPSGMTVVAVGNLPVEELTETIINSLTIDKINPQPEKIKYQSELPFTEIITDKYIDSSLQQSRLILTWRVPGLENFSETLPLDVLAVILGQGKLSRLFRDLRENRHLVTRISANNITNQIQGVFSISAQLSKENISEVKDAIINHLRKIQINGITQKELNRVCQIVANQFIFQSEKPSDRTNLYGYYYSQINTIIPALEYAENIRRLTIEDIQKAAQKFLDLNAYGVVIALDN